MYDCDNVSELLTSFVSGELPPEEENAVSEHVRECGSCCDEAEKYTLALEKGRAAFGETIELSPEELAELKYQVMSAATADDRRKTGSTALKGAPTRRFKLFKYASIAASVLAAAVLAVGWAYLAKIDKEPPKETPNPHRHDRPTESSEGDFDQHLLKVIHEGKARRYIGSTMLASEKALYEMRMVRSFSVKVEGRAEPVYYYWYGGPRILVKYTSDKQLEIERDFIRRHREGGPLEEALVADEEDGRTE